MEFKKPTEKSAKVGVPLALGAIGGAMLSNGLTSAICKPKDVLPTPEELKKKKVVQYVMVGGSVLALCAIQGTDVATNTVTGVLAGIATAQATSLIANESAKSSTLSSKLVADTKTNTFFKAALGLGCPCSETNLGYVPDYSLNRPKRRRGMKGPNELEFMPVQISMNNMASSQNQNAVNNWRAVS